MPLDPTVNFPYSTVATAPSPATSGTSLVVQAGEGANFPAAFNFEVVIWPINTIPKASNAEIATCTGRATDTLTIVRSGSPRTVVVGDQIAAAITLRMLQQLEGLRVQTVASAATVTPSADADDIVTITAQAEALTIANPTPVLNRKEGQSLIIRIKDNGTARAITFGAQYRAMGTALPTTTVLSKTLYLGFKFNSTDTKWDLLASGQET